MTQAKNLLRTKEPVKLRAKKLVNGNLSLYLDSYIDGSRKYEFLRLYLIPEKSRIDRTKNDNTLRIAEIIRAKRILDIQYSSHGLTNPSANSRILLLEWMRQFADKKRLNGRSQAYYDLIIKTIRHLKLYRGDCVTMKQVTKEYCLGFIEYLKNQPIAGSTMACYFRCLNCGLNAAVKDDVISENPIAKIPLDERIKIPDSSREYLTRDEIIRLVHAPCSHPQIKMAYLFGCMCALRLSDIRSLRWRDIQRDGNQWRASVIMVKTRRTLWLPLSDEAVRWLPQRGNACDDELIFSLPGDGYLNKLLKEWVKKSGINKHITFHTSRHTHATMLLSLGVDLYTVSKLLGHSQIKTTQIYAKVIDRKKDEAVNMIPAFSMIAATADSDSRE